jgi:hypothetical protein
MLIFAKAIAQKYPDCRENKTLYHFCKTVKQFIANFDLHACNIADMDPVDP